MSRTKLFFRNTLFSAILSLVTLLIGLVVPRIYLVNYGSEINGLVTSINQLLGYFSLVQLGLSGASVYALYKPIANQDTNSINAIVSSTAMLYRRSGYIYCLLSVILASVYPFVVSTQQLNGIDIFFLVIVLCGGRAIDFFIASKYSVYLIASQKSYVISITSIVELILNAIIIFALASPNFSIIWIKVITLLAFVIKTVILFVYCKRTAGFLRFNAPHERAVTGPRRYVLIQEILGSVQMGAPVVIITLFLTLSDVSVYSVFNLVGGGIASLLSIFITGLPAGFGELIAKNEKKELQRAFKQFEIGYNCVLAVLFGVTASMIMPFIAIYTQGVNDTEYYVPIYGILMVMNGLFYSIKTPNSMLIISAGKYKEVWWRNVITALIIVIGGIILTPVLKIAGVLIASILSNVYRTVDMLFFVPKYISGLPKAMTLRRIMIVLFEVFIIYIASNIAMRYIEIKTYTVFFLYASLMTLVSVVFVGSMAIIFDRQDMKGLWERVKHILQFRRG